MSFEKCWQSPTNDLWRGRADAPSGSAFFQRVQMLPLNVPLPLVGKSRAFALLGFASDEGIARNTGRVGAAGGPDALRSAMARLAIHRAVDIYDAGNIVCTDHNLEEAQQALGESVHLLLAAGYIPLVLGGGHEMAWGHYQGIARQGFSGNFGIVNLDAHFDMRPLGEGQKGSSGSPFLQIAMAHEKAKQRFDYTCIGIQPAANSGQLFATAKAYGVHAMPAETVFQNPDVAEKAIHRALHDNVGLYLSICLDVFCAAVAPGVSAPQPLGLMPWQVVPWVRLLAASGKMLSYDIAELSPALDSDNRTVKLAAHLVYEIIHHHK